jgi:hypothetical protein
MWKPPAKKKEVPSDEATNRPVYFQAVKGASPVKSVPIPLPLLPVLISDNPV